MAHMTLDTMMRRVYAYGLRVYFRVTLRDMLDAAFALRYAAAGYYASLMFRCRCCATPPPYALSRANIQLTMPCRHVAITTTADTPMPAFFVYAAACCHAGCCLPPPPPIHAAAIIMPRHAAASYRFSPLFATP